MEGNSQRPQAEPPVSSQDLCEPPLNEENFPAGKVGAAVLGPTLLLQTKELSPRMKCRVGKAMHFFCLFSGPGMVWGVSLAFKSGNFIRN